MFERKNQGILSEHYAKLIDHEDNDVDQDDDFITLKRADHDLSGDEARPTQQSTLLNKVDHEDISQRKLKIGQSKRAMLKYKSGGTKLVFDDEGGAHPLYEMQDDTAFQQEAGGDVIGAGKLYVDQVRTKMRDEDVLDKQEARDKKKEKKRKRKAQEQEAQVRFLGVLDTRKLMKLNDNRGPVLLYSRRVPTTMDISPQILVAYCRTPTMTIRQYIDLTRKPNLARTLLKQASACWLRTKRPLRSKCFAGKFDLFLCTFICGILVYNDFG
jgi:hypothetical protein